MTTSIPRGAVFAALACSTAALSQTPAQDPARVFGALEAVQDIDLSDDGSKLLTITPLGTRQQSVVITRLDTKAQNVVLSSNGDGDRIHWCRWAGSETIVCRASRIDKTSGSLQASSRLFVVGADGSKPRQLGGTMSNRGLYSRRSDGQVIDWNAGKPGEVLMTNWVTPEDTLQSAIAEKGEGLAIFKIDAATGRRSMLERPVRDAVGFISDGHGAPRIWLRMQINAGGYLESKQSVLYRRKGSKDWDRLFDRDVGDPRSVEPLAVDFEGDRLYVIKPKDGMMALWAISLDGSKTETLVYANPRADVVSVATSGKAGRVVGATFHDEHPQTYTFDPAYQKLLRSLSKALPAGLVTSIVDESDDGSRVLVSAHSDKEPGRYYVFDKAARQLNEIALSRPALEGAALGSMSPVSFRAADGTMIPGYLTLPPGRTDAKGLPAIVMPHGGPSARDTWGFDWLAQYFAVRGYAVLQPNYRGSSGYGAQHFGDNAIRNWEKAIGDINDGARWLVREQGVPAARLFAVGWSYGGYAVLQGAAVDPGLYKAVAAIAPVTEWQLEKKLATRSVIGRIDQAAIGSGTITTTGSPAYRARDIKVPVLLAHGDLDINVDIEHSRVMKTALENAGGKVELLVYPGLDHGLQDNGARTAILSKIDALLAANGGK